MRRRYHPLPKQQQPFISNYHICQVPLPYYNPLADPHLKGYFSNRKVQRHIGDMGLLYSPKKEYPYFQRRSKNYHKHLKDNLCKTPPTHVLQHSNFQNRSYLVQSQRDLAEAQKEHYFGMPRRKAGSQILGKEKVKWQQMNDLIIRPQQSNGDRKRHHSPQINRKRHFSPESRAKSHIFERRRNFSPSKRQNAEEINLLP